MDVYKINFNRGLFYIGYTKNLKSRLQSHMVCKANMDKYNAAQESFENSSELINATEILHTGFNSIFYEKFFIYQFRDDPKMINRSIPKYEPNYSQWLDMLGGGYIGGSGYIPQNIYLKLEFISKQKKKKVFDMALELLSINKDIVHDEYIKSLNKYKGVK